MPPPTSGWLLAWAGRSEVRGILPLATFGSPDCEENTGSISDKIQDKICFYQPRKPDSSAIEKQELSALNEADKTNGPVSESRIGLVFILAVAEEGSYAKVLFQHLRWGFRTLPRGVA